jgi:hypothetical protein
MRRLPCPSPCCRPASHAPVWPALTLPAGQLRHAASGSDGDQELQSGEGGGRARAAWELITLEALRSVGAGCGCSGALGPGLRWAGRRLRRCAGQQWQTLSCGLRQASPASRPPLAQARSTQPPPLPLPPARLGVPPANGPGGPAAGAGHHGPQEMLPRPPRAALALAQAAVAGQPDPVPGTGVRVCVRACARAGGEGARGGGRGGCGSGGRGGGAVGACLPAPGPAPGPAGRRGLEPRAGALPCGCCCCCSRRAPRTWAPRTGWQRCAATGARGACPSPASHCEVVLPRLNGGCSSTGRRAGRAQAHEPPVQHCRLLVGRLAATDAPAARHLAVTGSPARHTCGPGTYSAPPAQSPANPVCAVPWPAPDEAPPPPPSPPLMPQGAAHPGPQHRLAQQRQEAARDHLQETRVQEVQARPTSRCGALKAGAAHASAACAARPGLGPGPAAGAWGLA